MPHGDKSVTGSKAHWVKEHGGWIALISLIVGVVLGGASLALDMGPSSAEEHIAACRKAHSAPSISEDGNREVFSQCTWPPVAGVEEDGYYEIVVTYAGIPNTAGFEQFTGIDWLQGPCATYRVQYRFEHMGAAAVEKAMELEPGQLVSMYDGSFLNYSPYSEVLPPEFPDGLHIASSSRYQLVHASCASL